MNVDADHGCTGGFGTFRKDSSAQRILTRAKIGIRDRPNIETVVGSALPDFDDLQPVQDYCLDHD
jgi:hypothetical protein